jgi:hypothetical protein
VTNRVDLIEKYPYNYIVEKKDYIMKKIDIAKEVCASLNYVKEDCLQALVAKLNITRGNASIYFAKASDAWVAEAAGTRTFATKPQAPSVKAPKEKEVSDAGKAKVRQEHNKAHAHLSYTEPPKA